MTLVSTTTNLAQVLYAELFFKCLVTPQLWCYMGAAGSDRECARCGRREYAHFYGKGPGEFYWRKVPSSEQKHTQERAQVLR